MLPNLIPFQVTQLTAMMRRTHFCSKQTRDLYPWTCELDSRHFPDHGRLFTFLAMADALRLLGSPGPWEREALSYYHHSLILDTVQPPYDNDVLIAGQGKELTRMIMLYNFNHFFTLLPTSFIHLYSMFLEVSSN